MSGGSAKLTATAEDQSEQSVIVDSLGVELHYNGADGRVSFEGDGNGGVTINGEPVVLVPSTDTTTTGANFEVLSGGTSYIYTQPLTSLVIDSIGSDCRAEFAFTAGSSFDLALPIFTRRGGASTFSSGTFYRIAVDGEQISATEYKIDSQVGAWYVKNATGAVVSAALVLSDAVVGEFYSGDRLYVGSRGRAINCSAMYHGFVNVSSGGTMTSTTVNQGRVYVAAGGVALGGVIKAYSLELRGGSASDFTISGGSMVVSNGGVLNTATVLAGGTLVVSSGGTALAVTSSAGATVTVATGGSAEIIN